MAQPAIAHVLHQLTYAGAEVLAAALARQLRDRYRFEFICLDQVGPLGEELIAEGFPVHCLNRKPGLDFPCANRIRNLSRERGYHLFHAHQYTPFFYTALSRRLGREPRILFTEHGRHYPDQRKRKRILANKLLLRRDDRVTAVGHFVKTALVRNEGIAADRIEVVHNGIDPAAMHVNMPFSARNHLREKLGVNNDQAMLLQVARFHPVKDHATALRALAELKKHERRSNLPGSLLVFAGEGEQRLPAEQLAAELNLTDRVRFLGLRTDIPLLMAGADIFMLTSVSEGLSVTLLEAMAARLPICATDVGGNGEVVIHQQTGLLSPRGDAPALAANLARLVADPALRHAMGDAGREHLLAHFTQQRMHESYTRMYQAMLDKHD